MNELSTLRDNIDTYFNQEQLHNLIFDLEIDYEDIPGETKGAKARELVDYCRRLGKMPELIDRLSQLRPAISWRTASADQIAATTGSVEAIRKILSACYRRAIFTRTHAQLDIGAMYRSIAEAIGAVQSQIMNISSPDMQQTAASIVGELDSILHQQTASFQDAAKIDESKLRILQAMTKLAKESGLPFRIPEGRLTEEVFFSDKEANREPSA
jgi:hypothetical protein